LGNDTWPAEQGFEEWSNPEIAQQMNIGRSTVYKILKEEKVHV
jgi:hypothetical protein